MVGWKRNVSCKGFCFPDLDDNFGMHNAWMEAFTRRKVSSTLEHTKNRNSRRFVNNW